MQQDIINDLVMRAKDGDEQAKNTLVQQNQPLIKSLLRRYLGKGVEYDDLFQLGCLGFVKAINKFDPQYKVKFTTYATPLIIGEIKRFLRDDGAVKVSRSVKTLYVKIKKFLLLKSGETQAPTVDEIATELGVTKEEVIFAMEASHMPLPLFATTVNDDSEDSSCLADKIVASDDSAFLDQIMVKNMLARLPLRERQVILLRYFRNATQSEVARTLQLSQVQVSRIERKVLNDMKAYLSVGEGVI
ncbi:MAG: SigB/SigF/SigG family RNA polymerase sigma factor [Clostridia bacterium]|nr:SigB/SigF/SigG family RNA polymerase sigma factor [Clostridia bacterium]